MAGDFAAAIVGSLRRLSRNGDYDLPAGLTAYGVQLADRYRAVIGREQGREAPGDWGPLSVDVTHARNWQMTKAPPGAIVAFSVPNR